MSAHPIEESLQTDQGTTLDASARTATSVFGLSIDLAAPSEVLGTISDWAKARNSHRVMYVNAHVVNHMYTLPGLRAALARADLVYCDGYGVRLAARAMHVGVPCRMTGADWIWGLASLSEARQHSLYLLGSEPPIAREAADQLQRWHPDLRIVGAHHGYFEPGTAHHERVLEDIREKAPDIVLVGMGTPKQELWVDRFANELGGPVVWTVGSLFDYVSGRTPRAPHLLADHGLEWMFRLAVDPRRMWRRYLIGNPAFLSRVYREARSS